MPGVARGAVLWRGSGDGDADTRLGLAPGVGDELSLLTVGSHQSDLVSLVVQHGAAKHRDRELGLCRNCSGQGILVASRVLHLPASEIGGRAGGIVDGDLL